MRVTVQPSPLRNEGLSTVIVRFFIRAAMLISLVIPVFVVCDLLISGNGFTLIKEIPLPYSAIYFACVALSLDFIPGTIERYRPFHPARSFLFAWLICASNLVGLFALLYAWGG